jgi:hypothetical protein
MGPSHTLLKLTLFHKGLDGSARHPVTAIRSSDGHDVLGAQQSTTELSASEKRRVPRERRARGSLVGIAARYYPPPAYAEQGTRRSGYARSVR